ncbi:GDSL-type esterase/lipase family protein [Granulosicoccus sp. 3-233]|uniref:GDSL-type esterase/lipase family protein n=1 Tax=Granulosicoccus sp. 3-233 TaxID=3417969 RepID=UPI003D34E87D
MVNFAKRFDGLQLKRGGVLATGKATLFTLVAMTAQVQALDIMPLGDSITEGYGACSYRTPLVESFGNCNVTMVGSKTAPRAKPGVPLPTNCITTNTNSEGHSGYSTSNFMDTSPYGVSRVRYWVDQNTPDVVLLHVGSNDMANLTSSTAFPGEYDPVTNTGTGAIGRVVEMINEIYAENSNASIYVADLIPWYESSVVDARIDELRIELAIMVNDRASDGDDIQTVAVSPGYQPSMMDADQVHPNEIGEKHIAARFARALHDDNICKPTPQITSPQGTTLQGATQSFTWNLNNMDGDYVENWQVRAGSSSNRGNYGIASGSGSATQATLTGLPTNGETVHVTVRIQYFTGQWVTASQIYTAASVGSGETCNGKPVTVYLANGDSPTAGDDVILGTAGNDTINALGGNDTICALAGNDTIDAGNGNDWVDASAGNDVVDGGDGNDYIIGGSGNDELSGGEGDDELLGHSGDDQLVGENGADVLKGGDGVDLILGGPGNDNIITGNGSTVGHPWFVSGGSGNDTITGGSDNDDILGATGDDLIIGNNGDDELAGGDGEDVISGGNGMDTITGGNDDDELDGGNGNDVIYAGAGDDIVTGGNGRDILVGHTGIDDIDGGAGNDHIRGGDQDDTLKGGDGNDYLTGQTGNDSLNGGPMTDTCDGGPGSDTASQCETELNLP